jgi:hypothetical protein
MMRAIEIKLESGENAQGNLGMEGIAEFDDDTQGEDGNNILDEFQMSKDDL